MPTPHGKAQQKQKTWDTLKVSAVACLLLEMATNASAKARLPVKCHVCYAVSVWHWCAWYCNYLCIVHMFS